MFAVPGWDVSSTALKTQTLPKGKEQSGDKGHFKNEPPPSDSEKSKRRSRKRKQKGDRPNNGVVTDDNLPALWARYIDGNGDADRHHALSKKKRKRKHQNREEPRSFKEPAATETGGFSKSNGLPTSMSDRVDGDRSTPKSTKESKGKRHEKKHGRDNGRARGESVEAPSLADVPKHRLDKQGHPWTGEDGKFKTQEKGKKAKEAGSLQENEEPFGKPSELESIAPISNIPGEPTSKLTPLQAKMRAKLTSARFRHLNETLYTSPSTHAHKIFTENPELFDEYHAGFSQQVITWPESPVDGYVAKINSLAQSHRLRKNPSKAKPSASAMGRTKEIYTIADLGCGDARLARSLNPAASKLDLRILSYDFRKTNKEVTAADISKLPLPDRSVDLAIFCLSLMGTNWIECIEEAWRVLEFGGECWISEVKSRFGRVWDRKKEEGKPYLKGRIDTDGADQEYDGGGTMAEDSDGRPVDGTDVSAFVDVVQSRGLLLKPESVDKSNKMFVRMEFVKSGSVRRGRGKWAQQQRDDGKRGGSIRKMKSKSKFLDEDEVDVEQEAKVLKPCVYKTR